MAIDLLNSQVQHHNDEKVARRRGRPGPPTLSTERQAYHDLEGLLWVLVYAMMIHSYNSLTHEADRKEYKVTLDDYFGHGSARTIFVKRHAMLSFAHSKTGLDHISKWFTDQHERRFFIRCMALIAKHHKAEEEEEDGKAFEGEITDDIAPWGPADDDSDDSPSPDEDAKDTSGTYKPVKTTKAVQTPAAGPPNLPAVITYESVISLLMNPINELK